ncbi:hypothetical protein BASA82_000593 [Batrachochytrium salamandrivorans]|nr:hypothetical protein BASA82_000593 [Batrachochytrium salamandrivorans]
MSSKLPPPLPPRTSKGIVLQPPPSSSEEDNKDEDEQTQNKKLDPKMQALDKLLNETGVAPAPPARPPRPANFTVPPNLQLPPTSREEEDAMLSRMAAKPKPVSEDPNSIQYEKPERATKFTYNAEVGKWEMKTTKVRLAKDSFSEGGMRFAYRAVEVGNTTQSFVIKLFKNPDTKPAVVFHEALTQAVSERYAQGFNHLCETKEIVLRLRFLPVWVLHLTQRSKVANGKYTDLYATMEPYLPGKYVKLSDNSGRHLNDVPAQAAQTFSHYSFLASGKKLVCVDIQGVSELVEDGDAFTAKNMTLTDPQIHSLDGTLFGAGNLGVKGINAFITSYKRTMYDEQLGLALLTSEHLLQDVGEQRKALPQEKAGAPPFDTAELASILAADERARLEEEQEALDELPPALPDMNKTPKILQREDSALLLPMSPRLDSSSRRTIDFSTGGELFQLSLCARSLAMSIDI